MGSKLISVEVFGFVSVGALQSKGGSPSAFQENVKFVGRKGLSAALFWAG